MSFAKGFGAVRPYIVKIESPDGHGTGFFFACNKKKTVVAVATALHVVDDADLWKKPIRITHEESGKSVFLDSDERAVFVYAKRDAAAIIFNIGELPFPQETLPLMDKTKYKRPGTEVAWAGYPAICNSTLCLFQGAVSAFMVSDDTYLIDGVAINGVSGGPVFVSDAVDVAELVGIVSAYWPNRRSNETLPGLLMAHDVTDLHEVVEHFKSLDDAKEKAETEKAAEPPKPTLTPDTSADSAQQT